MACGRAGAGGSDTAEMTSSKSGVRRRSLYALALLAVFGGAAPLVAQPVQTVQSTPDPDDPVERLGRFIRILAVLPRDLNALLGAGQAALDVGDPNAALGFFARAEAVSPANGAVKAGLGSSLVMIERPDDALRLFAEASSLGVPDAVLARDRGLAYDLRGDTKRAQHDYALALTRERDDELVRRYALSLGISGDRAGAMTMLEPLLRKQDQGAWRARAFIMAMTGDVSGANGVARQLMVPAMADAMSPLLARLATLNPAERAHAVNFGTVPSDGTRLAVQTGDPYLSGIAPVPGTQTAARDYGSGLIPAGEPLGPRPEDVQSVRVAQSDSLEARRRPGTRAASPGFTTPPATVGQPISTARVGPVDPARLPPAARGEAVTVTGVVKGALPPPGGALPTAVTPPPDATPVQTAQTAAPPSTTVVGPPADAAPASPYARAFAVPAPTTPAPTTPTPTIAAAPVSAPAATPADRLAGLLDGVEPESETTVELPSARELRAARAAARKKVAELTAQAAAEAAAKKEREEKAAAAKKYPARLWVQVATGRNDSGLALTWRRLRDDAAALKGQTPWSAPFKATNRIVVGPMKSAAAARELVNKLAKDGVQATVWSSDAGEEVERISAK